MFALSARSLTRALTARYVVALAVIAILAAAGQVVVQAALNRQADDARIVNLAGRQRMLSQRLAMLSFARADAAEIVRVAADWESGERALRFGAAEAELGDAETARIWKEIQAHQEAMLAAARAGTTEGLLAAQAPYLAGMDAIVSRYDATARARVASLRSTEALLFALMLGAIALDGLLVFRPAVAGLRRHLDERRRAEAAVLEVSDREQRRIGQDLHDGLAQLLAGVALMLKRVEKHAPDRAEITSIRALVDEAMGQTRTLAKGLYATELDREGLESALRELCASTEAIYRVHCAAEVSVGGAKIDPARGVHLYRVAREAVINAAKHAKAERIAISLARDDGAVVLEVTDDGAGFDPDAPSHGMGIHLMRYRASVVEGELDVKSSPGEGTTVTCRVPLVETAPS